MQDVSPAQCTACNACATTQTTFEGSEKDRVELRTEGRLELGEEHHGSHVLELPAAVRPLIPFMDEFEPSNKENVPSIVARNPLWLALAPLVKEVHLLQDSEQQAVLMLQLQDAGTSLVFKAVAADRADTIHHQIWAEMDAASNLPWHPLMGTLLAAHFDDDGNWCCVTPYAGFCLHHVIESPEWSSITAKDKLAVARSVIAHSLVVYEIMQQVGCGYVYRGVKPLNVCVDPLTGHVKIIDFGLTVRATLEDYFDGYTPGYCTPELAEWSTFRSYEKRKQATNLTTDVFLTSFMGLEVAVGLDDLPWQLKSSRGGGDSTGCFCTLLEEHAAAGKAGYSDLIHRVSCPFARDFFRRTMCRDPCQRMTPAQALQHKWLAGCRAAVLENSSAAGLKYKQQNQYVIQLLREVPYVLIPRQMRELGGAEDSKSSSTNCACSDRVGSRDNKLAHLTPQPPNSSASPATSSVSSDDSHGEKSLEQRAVSAPTTVAAAVSVIVATSGVSDDDSHGGKSLKQQALPIVSTPATVAASAASPAVLDKPGTAGAEKL